MLKLSSTTRFNRDLKLCKKRGYDLNLLYNVVNILRIPEKLPYQNKDHDLKGNFTGKRECHVASDWLLVYRIKEDELVLDRTGTHADLFKM